MNSKSPYITSAEMNAYAPFVDYDDPDAVTPTKIEVSYEDYQRLVATLVKVENMEGDTFRALNLGNATPEFLVDELKGVRDQIKPRQTYEKLLSGILKDNHNPPNHLITTSKNAAFFEWIEKRIPDKEKVAQVIAGTLTVTSYDEICKDSCYWQIKIKAIA